MLLLDQLDGGVALEAGLKRQRALALGCPDLRNEVDAERACDILRERFDRPLLGEGRSSRGARDPHRDLALQVLDAPDGLLLCERANGLLRDEAMLGLLGDRRRGADLRAVKHARADPPDIEPPLVSDCEPSCAQLLAVERPLLGRSRLTRRLLDHHRALALCGLTVGVARCPFGELLLRELHDLGVALGEGVDELLQALDLRLSLHDGAPTHAGGTSQFASERGLIHSAEGALRAEDDRGVECAPAPVRTLDLGEDERMGMKLRVKRAARAVTHQEHREAAGFKSASRRSCRRACSRAPRASAGPPSPRCRALRAAPAPSARP